MVERRADLEVITVTEGIVVRGLRGASLPLVLQTIWRIIVETATHPSSSSLIKVLPRKKTIQVIRTPK